MNKEDLLLEIEARIRLLEVKLVQEFETYQMELLGGISKRVEGTEEEKEDWRAAANEERYLDGKKQAYESWLNRKDRFKA